MITLELSRHWGMIERRIIAGKCVLGKKNDTVKQGLSFAGRRADKGGQEENADTEVADS